MPETMRCNVAFLSGLPTPTCRKPYIYISGDVPVPIARYTSITNIDTCADHCESKSNCCSFEFRQKERKCNINMECKPTGPVHVQVHDQIFCGKHFLSFGFIGNFIQIWSPPPSLAKDPPSLFSYASSSTLYPRQSLGRWVGRSFGLA